jgi:hypothetical protein
MRLLLMTIALVTSTFALGEVNILLKNNTDKESQKREQIAKLIQQYDLKKWWFTDDIIIDETTRSPFSHPVLTLTASMPNNDPAALSQLLHEQIHWFEDERPEEVESTITALKALYPSVPVGYPEGARDEFSTYLHIAVCLMELDALAELLGKQQAQNVIATNGKYFYKWIYSTVLQDQEKIRQLLKDNKLYI